MSSPPAAAGFLLGHLIATTSRQSELLARLALTHHGPGSEEVLHDVRVTLRRVAAVARLSRGAAGGQDGLDLLLSARRTRRELSPLRSQEVCRRLLLETYGKGGGARAARSASSLYPPVPVVPYEAALTDVLERLETRRRELEALARDGARLSDVESRLQNRVRRRLQRRLELLLESLPPQLTTLHRSRIAAKAVRYGFEFCRPILVRSGPLLDALVVYQEAAGTAHDLHELSGTLSARAPLSRARTSLLGRIFADAATALAKAVEASGELLEVCRTRPPGWSLLPRESS